MTWTASGHPWAAILGLVLCAIAGWWVPALIARLPEPEPEPDDADEDQVLDGTAQQPKELYVVMAAIPRLGLWCSLAAALTGAAVAASVGWSATLFFLLPLVPVGVALAVVDARTRLLPKRLVLPATGFVLVVAIGIAVAQQDRSDLLRGVVGFVVVRSLFWVLWWFRSSGMGFGDVRLAGLLGLGLGFLGTAELVVGMYAAFIVFVVPGLLVAVVRRDRGYLRSRVPFGPHLLAGAVIGIALGPWIARGMGY